MKVKQFIELLEKLPKTADVRFQTGTGSRYCFNRAEVTTDFCVTEEDPELGLRFEIEKTETDAVIHLS